MGRLFGTDGVRGIANSELTCEMAMNIGRAAAMVLTNEDRRHPRVLIGKDTRKSSDMLEAAITAGLCSVGANVIQLGVVPTPAVAYLVGKYKADAGVVLTASHNPCEFNGIKIFSGDGYKLPDALEEQIEAIVLDHAATPPVPIGGDLGTVHAAPDAVRDYVDHVKSTVPFSLDGLHIAIDCANGASSRTAELLFTELGAKVDMLFDKPDGVNVNDKCGSTHMDALMEYVKTHGVDAGIAFDGDADRCLAVDEKGNFVDGDFIMATKVGDRYVLEEMLLEGYNFGGEQSGHVIFLDFATTGDGQMTAAHLLSLMRRREAKLSSLATIMQRFPQVMVNVTTGPEGKLRFYTDDEVKESIEKAKAALGDSGRIIVRPSGTEPLLRVMVEGEDEEQINALANEVADVLRRRLA